MGHMGIVGSLSSAPLSAVSPPLCPLPLRYESILGWLSRQTNLVTDRDKLEEPALCLVCGQVVVGGRKDRGVAAGGKGECTLHAEACGGGVGVFLLLNKSSVAMFR